jgi:predicted AAA+ superfamily ATPase
MFRLKRNITESINYLLNNFPCVVILGARQVGKSTLLKQILPNASFFDLERDADFQRINNDPELFLQETNRPIIFDEAQISASLFKALRVEIDKNRDQAGQFLLSGSSSPELLKHISETLAGRVAIVELEPFQWQEGLKKNYPDLITALSEEEFQSLQPNFNKRELLELCLYGGYPEPFLKRDDIKFFRLWMENYIKTYVERDIRALFPSLQLDVYKRFVQMLAYASGEIINNSNFARSLDVSQPTIKNYLNIIEGTFLWRKIPSYQKNLTKRIIKMPKGYLRDTGLINYFLRIQTVNDLKSHPQFGRIWEIFISEQLIRHFKNKIENIEYFYYRTHNQAEIDLIIETQTGLIPIEIKSGFSSSKRQIQTLQRFIEEHHCPFGLLINNGDEIFKLSQNIYQLPAIYL